MNQTTQQLMLAEQKAKDLFDIVEERGFITPGKTESQLIEEIAQIARAEFGIEKYWHKKIVHHCF